MRLLTAICVAAIVVAFSVPAFAETQSVKVSGDITIYHIAEADLDLNKDDDNTIGTGATSSDTDEYFADCIGLNVEADLTDNVSTFIRLVNERNWSGLAGLNDSLYLDQAYVTLEEFLYAPLTLTIGRQDLWFGKGLIIGNNNTNWSALTHFSAEYLSAQGAFDAIRATLDYDPWTIDLVYARIDDTDGDNDDIDLLGINLGYLFDRYDAEAEAYWWLKNDQSNKPGAVANSAGLYPQNIQTFGLRGSLVPYADMYVWAEGAVQVGSYANALDPVGFEKKDREAWALDLGVDYKWVETPWTPKAGLEYLYFSGDSESDTGDFTGWDPMYKGKFDSLIREFMDVLPSTATDHAGNLANLRNRLDGNTNQHQIKGMLTVEPITDLTIDSSLSYFQLDEVISGTMADDDIGWELDGGVTYDYTEDVTFLVKGGVFWPGKVYPSDQDDTAAKLISAVTVEF